MAIMGNALLSKIYSELMQAGLSGEKLKYAHALIGRSIFIRYLEDRGVLTIDYILEIASQNPEWRHVSRR